MRPTEPGRGIGQEDERSTAKYISLWFDWNPINRADRNTFFAFGAEEDESGYMSRYGFEESIRDGATKKLHFEPRMVDLRIDREGLNEAFENLTEDLDEEDKNQLAGKAANLSVLIKSDERSECHLC